MLELNLMNFSEEEFLGTEDKFILKKSVVSLW